MGAALIILLVVASGERADASTRALGAALEQAARRPISLSVREVARVPDDAQVARMAADGKADVVVELGWRSPRHDHAVVHLHTRSGELLRASELDFGATEPRAERGRAVGFAIATMLADEPVEASIMAAIASRSAAESVPEAAASPPLAPDVPGKVAPPASPAALPTSTTAAPVPAPPDRDRGQEDKLPRFAVEGAGSALSDARGEAVGGGPLVRLQWNAARQFGLRLGGCARWFTVGGRSASELGATAGILWTFVRRGVFAAATRAELGLLEASFTEEVTRTNPRGMVLPAQTVAHAGLAPSFLAGLEGDWRAGRVLVVFLAVNLEASTRTLTASSAVPSPIWAGLEAGVRISF